MKHSRKLLSAAIASVIASSSHAFVVDGINTNGNEYQHTQNWNIYTDNSTTNGHASGYISYGYDSSNIYILLAAPSDIVDNVYGIPSNDPASGWVTKKKATKKAAVKKKAVAKKKATKKVATKKAAAKKKAVAKKKATKKVATKKVVAKKKATKKVATKKATSAHTFQELLVSDGIWFDLDVDGDGFSDGNVAVDYLELLSAGYYGAEVVGSSKKKKATKKKAVAKKKATTKKKNGGDLGYLVDSVATSLEYNLSKGNTCSEWVNGSPKNSIASAACVDQVMYEFSFLRSDVTDFNFSSISHLGIHASGNKLGTDGVFRTCVGQCRPVDIPEPATTSLLIAGLSGLLWSRRKKRKT